MKRRFSILLAFALTAALLLGLALQVSAKTSRVEVSADEYFCATGMEKYWESDGIMHIRDYVHVVVEVSDQPEMAGLNTTVADADINMKTGEIVIRGTMSLKPTAYPNGSWEGTWYSISNKGVIRGQGVAQGKGELSGKTLFLELIDVEQDPATTAVKCEGIGMPDGNGISRGYILDNSEK